MKSTIYIFGHANKEYEAFRNAKAFRQYMQHDVFEENKGRYRYSQARDAEIIVMSLNGKAYGHFEIAKRVQPTPQDMEDWPPTRAVYMVTTAHTYEKPVDLHDLGITGIQFGKPIDLQALQAILQHAGKVTPWFAPPAAQVN